MDLPFRSSPEYFISRLKNLIEVRLSEQGHRDDEALGYLQDEARSLIIGMEQVRQALQQPQCPSEHAVYKRFLETLFPSPYNRTDPRRGNQHSDDIWNRYLMDLHLELRPFPQSDKELYADLVDWHTTKWRATIMPVWTTNTIRIIDEAVDSLNERDRVIIRCTFGLGCEIDSHKHIAKRWGCARTDVSWFYKQALKQLRGNEALKQLMQPIGNAFEIVPRKHLFKVVYDLELGIRASNAVCGYDDADKETGVSFHPPLFPLFVGDLIQITEKELLRQKQCGKVTVNEIKKYLDKMGLHLGTVLHPDLKQELNEARTNYKPYSHSR